MRYQKNDRVLEIVREVTMESSSMDKNEVLFIHLVIAFQTAAWQQMGKLKNPLTDKVEKNLDQARYHIDMLEMIKNRTAGRLTENEQKFLNRALSELQMNFVIEIDKEKAAGTQKAPEKPEAGEKTASTQTVAEKPEAGEEKQKKEVKRKAEKKAEKEPETGRGKKKEAGKKPGGKKKT